MSRVVWRQFGLAILVVMAYLLLGRYHEYLAHPQFAERVGGMVSGFLLDLPRGILFALPFAVGASLSLLPMRAGAFRTALWVSGGVTAALVVNDLVADDLWDAIEARSMGSVATDGYVRRFDDTTSSLGGAFAHLLGRVQPGDIQNWPPKQSSDTTMFRTVRDPNVIIRLSAVRKYGEALWMLAPLVVAGLVLGFGAWLGRVATFRAPRDERLFRLGAGWGITIVATGAFGMQMMGSMYTLSSPRASLAWMFLPYVVVMVPAFLGWRAVWRLDRLAGE
jgi:hypothetical protein